MILLPQQPDFARAFGEQIFARKTHGDGKSFRAFADQHDVAGVLHHSFRNQRNILDVADAAHGSGAARGPVHAAGVEFDYAFFVGKAAESDGVVVRIVFRTFYNADGSVERVAAAFQESEGVVEIIEAVVGADDDRPLAGCQTDCAGARDIVFRFVLRIEASCIQASGQRCSDCGTQKSTTAYGHEFLRTPRKRREG